MNVEVESSTVTGWADCIDSEEKYKPLSAISAIWAHVPNASHHCHDAGHHAQLMTSTSDIRAFNVFLYDGKAY
jgi:hypothetical protein